jgi:hypothetical protein
MDNNTGAFLLCRKSTMMEDEPSVGDLLDDFDGQGPKPGKGSRGYPVRARDARVRVTPGQHQNSQYSTRDISITIAPIDGALADLESRKPGEPLIYGKTAAKYSVERCTLARRHQGIQKPRTSRIHNNES